MSTRPSAATRTSSTSSIVPHAPAGSVAEIATATVSPAATVTASVLGVDQLRQPGIANGANALAPLGAVESVMRTSLAAFSPSPCSEPEAR